MGYQQGSGWRNGYGWQPGGGFGYGYTYGTTTTWKPDPPRPHVHQMRHTAPHRQHASTSRPHTGTYRPPSRPVGRTPSAESDFLLGFGVFVVTVAVLAGLVFGFHWFGLAW